MREVANIRGLLAAALTVALGVTARHRTRVNRNQVRPRLTPVRVIHPDELSAEFDTIRSELRRRAS